MSAFNRLGDLPDWAIIRIPSTGICIVRNDAKPEGEKRVLVQFHDKTAAYIEARARVELISTAMDLVYAKVKELHEKEQVTR